MLATSPMRLLLFVLCVLVVGAGMDTDLAHAGKAKKVDWSEYLEDPSDRKPLVRADKGGKKADKAAKTGKSKRARKANARGKRGKR